MIKKGVDRAPHRSLLYATGVKLKDLDKPFIGVCNSYVDIIPGHIHLDTTVAFGSANCAPMAAGNPNSMVAPGKGLHEMIGVKP
ncbi:hypothetical protein [Lysinibacillus sp. K60]|uniref:hypothetical protein n=1 Tax=Lysinibacillus sp. K60 TaxID=2720027 RepID=UPI001C8C2796|nr:hypothetical protein [Lysinibacillus sp. K60]MBX8946768.1 hypothetical protein [Lysinibacillus sp. K60]